MVDRKENNLASIFFHNRGGIHEVKAKQYFNASGDSELAKLSGVPFTLGRDEDNKAQPLTMNVKIGNMNMDALRKYIHENWGQFDDQIRRKDKEKISKHRAAYWNS